MIRRTSEGKPIKKTTKRRILDVAAAAGVLKKMEEDSVGADARTFDALVLGTCKVKKVDGAMMLVRRMVDDGVLILYSTHMFVIRGLLQMLLSAFWDIRCCFDD
ncbi:Pentatricopeptide repeat-containing protein [Arachis hypogaea]|nr:Pentatricopeptide repeat-containing protein [Arachis hypogaea]